MMFGVGARTVDAPKLVFLHVMKTAGTSVIEWLQRHYKYDEVLIDASGWEGLDALMDKVSAEWMSRKRFIRGHFGSYITNYFRPDQGFHYISILRDPVERVISNYWHAKYSPDFRPDAIVNVAGFSLEEFLEHPVTKPYASNFQVRNFAYELDRDYGVPTRLLECNLVFANEVGEAELKRATAYLETIDVIGVAERIPDFIDDLSQRFGFLPDRNLGRYRSYRDPLHKVPADTIKKIRGLNELDLALYDRAQAEREKRTRRPRVSLYELPRRLFPRRRKTDRFVWSRRKVRPMTNPLDGAGIKLLHWSAKDAFFATGWSDVQSPDWSSGPPHRWSVRTMDPVVLLLVKKGARYLLLIEIFRFVDEGQLAGFSLRVDGEVVIMTGPVKMNHAGPGGGMFVADLGVRPSEHCSLTFHVDRLSSFNATNPVDPDTTPRGLALASMNLMMVD